MNCGRLHDLVVLRVCCCVRFNLFSLIRFDWPRRNEKHHETHKFRSLCACSCFVILSSPFLFLPVPSLYSSPGLLDYPTVSLAIQGSPIIGHWDGTITPFITSTRVGLHTDIPYQSSTNGLLGPRSCSNSVIIHLCRIDGNVDACRGDDLFIV